MSYFKRNRIGILVWIVSFVVLGGCATVQSSIQTRLLQGTYGTYAAAPRLVSGRIDTDRLVNELRLVHAQTYNFLIHERATDWDDLKVFLPKVRNYPIHIWVTLVPPSEPPTSMPYKLDYERWAKEIAQLSLEEPNLVAWSIDDFSYDAPVFTEAYLRNMTSKAHAINPHLAFIPCIYYKQIQNPKLIAKYKPVIDGILFPFRNESVKTNLSDWESLPSEIANLRDHFGPTIPIFVDVYATKHSRLNDSTPEYVRHVMTIAHEKADGILVFCHQYETKNPAKYSVVKELFENWESNL